MTGVFKKIIRWGLLLSGSLILFLYLALAGFFWWNAATLSSLPGDADSAVERSLEPHQLTLLDDGMASLMERIALIESAKSTIELEFFIYDLDLASRIITSKLIAAAERGVRVKLLVDFSAPVFKLSPSYAHALGQKNIEVRYYNTATSFRFIRMQHRSHRKLLIVDDERVITGGRNIADAYFNLSTEFNFLDSDVLIQGPIVKKMRQSFDTYWNSKLTYDPPDVDDAQGASEVAKFMEPDKKLAQLLAETQKLKERKGERNFSSVCNDITFVADFPGLALSNRQVYLQLSKFLLEAKTDVVGESPYFVLKSEGVELLKSLSDRGIKQKILTNSLRSTDAYYTISAMLPSLDELKSAGIDLNVYNGKPPSGRFRIGEESPAQWGIHAKRAVVDKKHILIGTYNVDPRSANLNSELLIICRDSPALAVAMLESINSRLEDSWPVFTEDSSSAWALVKGSSFKQKFMFFAAWPLSRLFDFLL